MYALQTQRYPGTLQGEMDIIPSTVQWQFIFVSLEAITIFSTSPWTRVKHVCSARDRLSDAEVTLKFKKGSFIIDTIDYLGHIIRPSNLEGAVYSSDAMIVLREPGSVIKLQFLNGFYKTLCLFISNRTRIANQLKKLSRMSHKSLTILMTKRELQ